MKLTKKRIGNLIRIVDEKNINNFDYPFYGININKEFMPSVANTDNVDRRKYKIICKNRFVFSGMQTGRDNCIRIGLYDKDDCVLVSPAYTTFEVVSQEILPEYLFMIFNSKEKDRYGSFLSDSSVRANLDWDRFCDIELDLPPIEIQKKYVAIYESMLKNLHTYEKGLDDLKLACDGYIENLKKNTKPTEIGKYINEVNVKNNDDNAIIAGISNQQKFIKSESRTKGVDKNKYYVVAKGNFAYSPIHINEGSIAYNDKEPVIVSPIYKTFTVKNNELDSEYLMMWFTRSEFVRYCWFHAFGSARDSFEWEQLCDVKISIPNIDIQRNIVKVFNIINKRKYYLTRLKTQIKNICPILIRGSIKECEMGD